MRGAVLVALFLASPASTETIWGDTGGCNIVEGGAAQSDMVFILTQDAVERWESACKITGKRKLMNGGQELVTTCSGEGESWRQGYIVEPVTPEGVLTIRPFDDLGMAFQLRKCG